MLLLRLFDRLRTELSIPLGIGEYQLLLEALEKGQGLSNPRSLLKLCETIWIKSQDDRVILRDMLKELMQEEVKAIDKLILLQKEAEKAKRKAIEEQNTPQDHPEESNTRAIDFNTENKEPEQTQEEEKEAKKTQDASPTRQQKTAEEEEAGVVLDLPINSDEKKAALQDNETFILSDTYLPLSIREMKQIWRMLRHAAKGGISREIDLPATVEAIAQEGILTEPVFQSDRINKIRLMLLVDHDGSMVAFNSLAQNMIESATKGGGHGQASVYYFNNCPIDYVYTSPNHIQHKSLTTIYNKTSPTYTVAMIISDAGAARANYSPERVAQTQAFLARLKKHVRRISWLNPMPRHRWGGTSAYFIADMVPMFELMGEMKRSYLGHKLEKIDSRKGMEQVISVLQGKRI